MASDIPFNPSYSKGQTVTANPAAASITIGAGKRQLVITNTGSQEAYIRAGVGAVDTSVDITIVTQMQIAVATDYLVCAFMNVIQTSL